MNRLMWLVFLAALFSGSAFGQALSGVNGDCQIGGQQALTSGLPSTATQQIGTTNVNAGAGVQASFSQCLVTVYATGTTNKANIYSNSTFTPQVLSNPFVANIDGSFTFFAAAGCYDVVMSSGAGPALPYTRSLAGVCVGQGTVTIPGGSGTVGSCGTPGALAYYSLAGTAITCDPNFVTDGSGNAIATSMTFNGTGAGFVGFVEGTLPQPQQVTNTAYLYSDTSIPTTFWTALPTVPGTLNQVLGITNVVDATHIKTGWVTISSGGCTDCVITDPTTDQTITGAHGLLMSDPGGSIWVKSTASGGGIAVGSGAPGNNGATGIDFRVTDTWTGAVPANSFRGINVDVAYDPAIAQSATTFGEAISLVTGTSSNSNSSILTGLDVFSATKAPGTTTQVTGLNVVSGIYAGGGDATSVYGIILGVDTAGGNVATLDALHITGFGSITPATGTVTNNRGIYIGLPVTFAMLTHSYGLYIDDQTVGGGNNPDPHGIFVAAAPPNDLGSGLTKVGSLRTTPVAFASIGTCDAGAEGTMKPITNSNTATWGATISGTGANHVLAYCDGTNWTVAAQ